MHKRFILSMRFAFIILNCIMPHLLLGVVNKMDSIHADLSIEKTIHVQDGFVSVGSLNLNNGKGFDIYISKVDFNGIHCWSKIISSDFSDFGNGITLLIDGNIAICGMQNTDGYFAKINGLTGEILHEKLISTTNNTELNVVIETLDGGFLLGGSCKKADFFLFKMTSTYHTEWVKSWGGTKWDKITILIENSDNDFTVGGWTYSFGNINCKGYVSRFQIKDKQFSTFWSNIYEENTFITLNDGVRTKEGGYTFYGNKSCEFNSSSYETFSIFLDSVGETAVDENNKKVIWKSSSEVIFFPEDVIINEVHSEIIEVQNFKIQDINFHKLEYEF
ncbi:MAG: hypothetical protein HYR91_06905 [Flavobacteriia bacterium]|nr:hypothetical protein [Flavobacteriia bacterium]